MLDKEEAKGGKVEGGVPNEKERVSEQGRDRERDRGRDRERERERERKRESMRICYTLKLVRS